MKGRTVLQLCVAALIVTCGTGEADSQPDFCQKITGPNGDTVYAVAINARGTIFAEIRDGVARSTDDGATWTLSNPAVNHSLHLFAFNLTGTAGAGKAYYGLAFRNTK